jgi:hypothetical protein
METEEEEEDIKRYNKKIWTLQPKWDKEGGKYADL